MAELGSPLPLCTVTSAKLGGARICVAVLHPITSRYLKFRSSRLLTTTSFQLLSNKSERLSTLQVIGKKSGFGSQPKKRTKKVDRSKQVKDAEDPITRAQKILRNKDPRTKDEITSSVLEVASPPKLTKEVQDSNVSEEEIFERRLQELKELTKEQTEQEEKMKYAPIEYDAAPPATEEKWTDNIFAKVGAGLAVFIFGLIFAFGDILPSGRPALDAEDEAGKRRLPPEYISQLQISYIQV